MKPTNEKPTQAIQSDAEAQGVLNAEDKRRALRRAYTQLFSGEVGEQVLGDLLHRYGWRDGVEMASYRPGMAHADMCFVEGQKEVIRYILTNITNPKEG